MCAFIIPPFSFFNHLERDHDHIKRVSAIIIVFCQTMSASAQALNKKPFLGHLFRTKTKHMHSSSLSSTRDCWTHCHDPYEPPTSLKARQETLDKLCGIIPSTSTSTPRRPRVVVPTTTTSTPSLRKCASSHNLRRAAAATATTTRHHQPSTDDDDMPLAMMVMKPSTSTTSRTRRKQPPKVVDDDNIPIALARRRLQQPTAAACY